MRKPLRFALFIAVAISLVLFLLWSFLPDLFGKSCCHSCVPIEIAAQGFLPADNDVLVEYVRKNYVKQPSQDEYNMTKKLRDTSMGQASYVAGLLNNQTGGFFVECGALDGETRSNTYMFERYFGWKGILIEADPTNFDVLMFKHRKAYSVPACLSSRPERMTFLPNKNLGKLVKKEKVSTIHVACFPLWTILLAVNYTTTIDYFSLDVEGHELEVLRTIPFDKLDIKVMSVEWVHVPEGKKMLRQFVESKGYKMVKEIVNRSGYANDFLFVKK